MKNYLENACKPDLGYFLDEARDGFFVSSMMKSYWAAQLKVLYNIDRVCVKHGIRWFADCGTLIGAVRHKGYIPWDDDLDICMLRADFEKFFSVAKSELPKEYRVHTLRLESEYTNMLGRILNNNCIDYSDEHLSEYYGCPYTIGIDIFVLDNVPEDFASDEKRLKALSDIANAVTLVDMGKENSQEFRSLMVDIERFNHVSLKNNRNLKKELLLLTEKLYRYYEKEDTKYVALMPFYARDKSHLYPKELFERQVFLPFEYVYMPVPVRYEEVLNIEYGNYMRVSKIGGIHNYPVYGEQESLLKSNLGENPYRYTMPKNLYVKKKSDLRGKLADMANTAIAAHKQIEILWNNDNFDGVAGLLEGCQNLAISMGTTLEEKVAGSEEIVHGLEEYCELIFNISGDYKGHESIESLDNSMQAVADAISEHYKNAKKEVVFFVSNKDWWKNIEVFWREETENGNEVYVIPHLYMINAPFTNESQTHDDKEHFPDHVRLTAPEEYDVYRRHPDKIYIQNPYDNQSLRLLVPDYFVSEKLTECTDELIYVPYLDIREPEMQGGKETKALENFIEQPVMLYADRIILNSEGLREAYLNYLVKLTGNRKYWEDKLTVKPSAREEHENSKEKKRLIFEVNISFLMKYKEKAVEKIRDSLKLITDKKDSLECIFRLNESLAEYRDEEIVPGWRELLSEIENNPDVIKASDDLSLESVDAYYGTSGNTAYECCREGVPVMIMDIIR